MMVEDSLCLICWNPHTPEPVRIAAPTPTWTHSVLTRWGLLGCTTRWAPQPTQRCRCGHFTFVYRELRPRGFVIEALEVLGQPAPPAERQTR